MACVRDVIAAMEHIAPPALAMDGDRERIGLHAGNPEAKVTKVALALDASLPALEAAKKMKAQMLVVHHPRFWVRIQNLVDSDLSGRRGIEMIRSGIAVYSAHTNLDSAPGGTNDLLARAAGMALPDIVEPVYRERLLKLTVFVPAGHEKKMVTALDKAGAGAIGNYSGCTFRGKGVGTFRCGEETKPFLGHPGSWEEVDELRIETIFGELARDKITAAMLAAHPYEEPAYDIVPIMGRGKVFGLGRVGDLERAENVRELAERMAKSTRSTETRYSGKGGRKVKRVAVWAGGGAPLERLLECGAEAVVTGEVGYHNVEAFSDEGIAVIELGHGWSEELALEPLAAELRKIVKGVTFAVAGRGFISMTNV